MRWNRLPKSRSTNFRRSNKLKKTSLSKIIPWLWIRTLTFPPLDTVSAWSLGGSFCHSWLEPTPLQQKNYNTICLKKSLSIGLETFTYTRKKLTTKRQHKAKEQRDLHCFSLMKEESKLMKIWGGGGLLGGLKAEDGDCTTYRARVLMLSTDMQLLYMRRSPPRQQPMRDTSQYAPMK